MNACNASAHLHSTHTGRLSKQPSSPSKQNAGEPRPTIFTINSDRQALSLRTAEEGLKAPMKYTIRAQPRIDKLPLFWTILNDGSVEKQEPDGREILASMKRAVIFDGEVRWYETCYCTPPLQHERSTVYDKFFSHVQIEPLRDSSTWKGESFWDYLHEYTNTENDESSEAGVTPHIKYVPIRIL